MRDPADPSIIARWLGRLALVFGAQMLAGCSGESPSPEPLWKGPAVTFSPLGSSTASSVVSGSASTGQFTGGSTAPRDDAGDDAGGEGGTAADGAPVTQPPDVLALSLSIGTLCGNPVPPVSCTGGACARSGDQLVVPLTGAGNPQLGEGGISQLSRALSSGRHPLAAADTGFGVTYVESDGGLPSLSLATFTGGGAPMTVANGLATPTAALENAGPVVAALPCGAYAVAWTDPGDGDELGIAIRLVQPSSAFASPVAYANDTISSSQHDPDIVANGTQLMLAWVDDSDPVTAPDIKYRTFDTSAGTFSPEQTLAATADAESDVSLAPFGGGFAAAWRDTSGGEETIQVQAGSTQWTVGPAFLGGPAGSKPALVALDPTRLLLAYTVGVDRTDSGVADGSKIDWAVLDTSAPGAVTGSDLVPLVSSSGGVDQAQPALVNGGYTPELPFSGHEKLALAWWTATVPGAANGDAGAAGEELWVKPLFVPETTSPVAWGQLDMSAVEVPLPLTTSHRTGDQRLPALASAPTASPTQTGLAAGEIVAAWDDLGRSFGPSEGDGDVAYDSLWFQAPQANLFAVDFSGMQKQVSSLAGFGLWFSRASTATVETDTNNLTKVGPIAAIDQPRMGSDGLANGRGLVLEERRRNYVSYSTLPSGALHGTFTGPVPTYGTTAPDGTPTANELVDTGAVNTSYPVYVASGLPGSVTLSKWVAANPQSANDNFDLELSSSNAFGGAPGFYSSVQTAPRWWTRYAFAKTAALPDLWLTYLNDEEQSGWSGTLDLWGLQVENGQFATEVVPTSGVLSAREGERIFVPNGATLVDAGRVGMYVRLVPKGARSAYPGKIPLWTVDAADYAYIDGPSGDIVVAIGGTVEPLATNVLNWYALDVVEIWLEAGGGALETYASYTDNGGVAVTVGAAPALGVLAPVGPMDILSNGTSSEFSSWVQTIQFYRSGTRAYGVGGVSSGYPATIPGSNAGPLLAADFTTLARGPLPSLPAGFNFARPSTATVQTSDSTIDTTPLANQARIGSLGTAWGSGLVLEEARTNRLAYSSPTSSSVLSCVGSAVSNTSVPAPDGSNGAIALSAPPVGSDYHCTQPIGSSTTGADFLTRWTRVDSSTPMDLAAVTQHTSTGFPSPARVDPIAAFWTRASVPVTNSGTAVVTGGPTGPFDTLWLGATGTGTEDLWGMQIEAGKFPTELIPTNGSAATRAGERLYVPAGSSVVSGGRIGMYARLIPKGARSTYSAPLPIWYADANDYASIDNLTGNVTVAVGAGTGGVQPVVLSTAPVQFAPQDVVEVWIEAGGGSLPTAAATRVNGGAISTVGIGATLGPLAPASTLDVLSQGTTSEWSSWVQQVSFWPSGAHPPVLPFSTQIGGFIFPGCVGGSCGSLHVAISATGSTTITSEAVAPGMAPQLTLSIPTQPATMSASISPTNITAGQSFTVSIFNIRSCNGDTVNITVTSNSGQKYNISLSVQVDCG